MEKFMRKMWKKSEGFTLVELIVVIAILGILAAVAVPAYTGYINKANEAADMQVLSSVATAVAGVLAADGQEVSQIVVTKSTGNVQYKIASGTLTDATSEMWKLMGVANATALKSEFSTKSTWTTATMQGGDWTLAY